MQTNQQVNSSLDYPVWLTCLDHATSQASKTSSHLNDLLVQAHSVLGASDSPPCSQHEISLPLCKQNQCGKYIVRGVAMLGHTGAHALATSGPAPLTSLYTSGRVTCTVHTHYYHKHSQNFRTIVWPKTTSEPTWEALKFWNFLEYHATNPGPYMLLLHLARKNVVCPCHLASVMHILAMPIQVVPTLTHE